MTQKRFWIALLCLSLLFCIPDSVNAAESDEQKFAAAALHERGILFGDSNGKMNLQSNLTRAHLAAILTRLSGGPDNTQPELLSYADQCRFSDVPDWAKSYIGYCYAHGLMFGYNTDTFGSSNNVTPAAACTVVLRYLDLPDSASKYEAACQTALRLGLATTEILSKPCLTRGDFAVILYHALQNTEGTAPETAGSVISYKGSSLSVGERSGLMIAGFDGHYTVSSSAPTIVSVEQVLNGNAWVAVANAPGTAVIIVSGANGQQASVTISVAGGSEDSQSPGNVSIDLANNQGIRDEMIVLINQVRRENGVPELEINQALMDAAQICSAQLNRSHNSQFECETAMACGYPHGFGSNLTVFTTPRDQTIAEKAVTNWVNSYGHFQTMIDARCETLGVGVTIHNGIAYCYMFAGDAESHNPYE